MEAPPQLLHCGVDPFRRLSVLDLHDFERKELLSMAEKTNYLLFLINAFQSLEDEIVSEIVLQLVSLWLWHSLSFGRFQMELYQNPHLIKKWKKMTKKEAKAKKGCQVVDPSKVLEVKFLRDLIDEFLEILDSSVILLKLDDNEGNQRGDSSSEQVDNSCVLYCERFTEFLIDLLRQLPTRRFLKPVIADAAVVAKCHLSALYTHEKGRRFAQLVDLLQFYEGFEIDDHFGTQLNDDDILLAHYSRLQAFQLLAFKQVPKLRDFALCNIGSIHKRADLSKKLSVLSDEELRELVCNKALTCGGCPDTWKGFSLEAFAGLWEFLKLSAASGVMLCLENWYYRILILLTGNLKNAEIAVDALSV